MGPRAALRFAKMQNRCAARAIVRTGLFTSRLRGKSLRKFNLNADRLGVRCCTHSHLEKTLMKPLLSNTMAAAALICGVSLMGVHVGAQQRGPDGSHGPGGPRPPLSAQDRAAFLDARLAALHVGLVLNADQEKLWPAVEAAARDRAILMMDLREKERTSDRPANPVDGLRRHGEADIARGMADTKLASAAQPLWAALSEEQRRRFPMLARGLMSGPEAGQRAHEGWRDRPMPADGAMEHFAPPSNDTGSQAPGRRPPPPAP